MPISPHRKVTALHGPGSTKMMERRRHNSCVDFTFCSSGVTNGTKLVKLNALFERVADREYGGIREEKLSKLIPSSPSTSLKYGHLQKKKRRGATVTAKSVASEDLQTISRGPFLAMFAHESMTFVNTLAINEKAERDKKKQALKQKGSVSQNKERRERSTCEKQSKHQDEPTNKDASMKASTQKSVQQQKQIVPAAEEPFDMVLSTPDASALGTSIRSRANTAPTGSAEFMQLLQDSSDDISSFDDASSCDDESSYGKTSNSFRKENVASFSNIGSSPPLSVNENPQQQPLSSKSRRRYRRSASVDGQGSVKSDGRNAVSLNRSRSRSISSHSDLSVDSTGSDQSLDSSNQFFPYSHCHNPYGNLVTNQKQLQQEHVVNYSSPIKPRHTQTPTTIAGDTGYSYENLLPRHETAKLYGASSPSPTKTLTTDEQGCSNDGDSLDLSSYSLSSCEDEVNHSYYHSFTDATIYGKYRMERSQLALFYRQSSESPSKDDNCLACSFLSSSVVMLRQTFPFLFKQSSMTYDQRA